MRTDAGLSPTTDPDQPPPAWILPGRPPGGLRGLAVVLRDRWWLALLVAALVVATGIGLWHLRSPSYRAESLLIVSPSSAPAIRECGLDVINDGGGLTRDVETLARLVRTPDVARRARATLHSALSADRLLSRVDAVPVGQSYLVSITASAGKPADAAALSNAFAQGTVAGRGMRFDRQVVACRRRLETSLASAKDSAVRSALATRIADLRALEGGGDPTVGIDTPATSPTGPSSPGLLVVILAAVATGIALGLGTAALAAALDRRIRSEQQLTEAYALPVVARVPLNRSQTPIAAARSSQLAPASAEAYRRIRQRVLASSKTPADATRSVLFSSTSRAEGRTTSAINTAVALAETGQRVLLVDLDLRHPNVASVLNIASTIGVHDVFERGVSLADAVNAMPVHSGTLDVLLALQSVTDLVDQVSPASVRALISGAIALGYDEIVFDAPELGSVSDALAIATQVDDVFVMVWPKKTSKVALASLTRAFADHGIKPRGFVVVGAHGPAGRGECIS